MKRTSKEQFEIIISFMEKNGDISKCDEGPAARLQSLKLWHELVESLNGERSGTVRTHQKWRGVWKDMKWNLKKKYRRYQQALLSDPNALLCWGDIEKRTLPFICEPNFSYCEADSSKTQIQDSDMQDTVPMIEIINDDDKTDGHSPPPVETALPEDSALSEDSVHLEDLPIIIQTSQDSPRCPSPSPLPDPGRPSPSPHPQISNDKNYSIADALIELNRLTRKNESNRDRMMYELEKERLRQRDVELKLQAQLISLLNGALDVVHSYLQTPKK